MTKAQTRALFLDRDGTLMMDTGYVRDPADVVLLPGVARGLAAARKLGFALVVVSNQSGIARGIIAPTQLTAVQARLEALLAAEEVAFDAVKFCLHGPADGCACRKPAPGMLRDAAADLGIDLQRSVMVGDRDSDVAAGRAAGCTTVIVGGLSVNADFTVDSFDEIPAILTKLAG
jgi:histidinol-phosphate phosphatase family protein